MFAALTQREPPQGILHHLRFRLFPPAPEPRRVDVPGANPFFVIEAPFRSGEPRWRAVARAAGACAGRMLFPDGVEPPESSGLVRFLPQQLPPLTVLSSFLTLLGGRRVIYSVPVALYDPRAAFAGRIGELVRRIAQVRVVTDRPAAYRDTIERMMREYGAALFVTDDLTALSGAPVVVAPFGLPPDAGALRGLVFAREAEPQARALMPSGICLPPPYDALLPPGVAPEAFGGALYELCAVRVLADAPCVSFLRDGTALSRAEAAALLAAL